MIKLCFKICLIGLLSSLLFACATSHPRKFMHMADMSELQQGKRDFEAGYYRRALHELLPLACDGYAEAQYAVGYMYYYGLGVAQDMDVGYFWIQRAADQGFAPAKNALKIMSTNDDKVKIPANPNS